MTERGATAEDVAGRIRVALESADLDEFAELLDPNVRWGAPDDAAPSCQNRDQVLQWYRRGRADGVRAQVTEMVVRADKILVGLKVVGNQAAAEAGDEADRWQVLAVRHGRIVDIRGFEDRATAASRVGLPMGAIFHVNEGELAWSDYRSDSGPAAIRYKALTAGASDVPPVQYIEYGPGETDAVHQHEIGEFFILTSGEMWLDNTKAGPGSVVFIPPNTDYAVRAGDEGVRYFRVVVG